MYVHPSLLSLFLNLKESLWVAQWPLNFPESYSLTLRPGTLTVPGGYARKLEVLNTAILPLMPSL